MLEPFLHLMLDGIDVATTVLFLLALWEGRQTRWLGIPCGWRVHPGDDVTRFLAQVRQIRPRGVEQALLAPLHQPAKDGPGSHRARPATAA